MKRRSFLKTASMAGVMAGATSAWSVPQHASHQGAPSKGSGTSSPENILLKDYKPKSIYKIPITEVPKAKFPAIDMHSHPYAKTAQEIAEW
ncbi:MAG TPA: twin-arginine translocation signal domain-containing protein, partial [Terriglobales bacterium]|nr:twin-arginine translocation signal domain-containing protein [Terriglobales bacterium]